MLACQEEITKLKETVAGLADTIERHVGDIIFLTIKPKNMSSDSPGQKLLEMERQNALLRDQQLESAHSGLVMLGMLCPLLLLILLRSSCF
jgi:hypothetical protein